MSGYAGFRIPAVITADGSVLAFAEARRNGKGDGTIVMLMTWNLGGDHERDIESCSSTDTRRVFVTRSTGNGNTWSAPEEITGSVKEPDWGWYATGPCHGIVKTRNPHRGRIIVPSNHSEAGSDGKPVNKSQLVCSDDNGRTLRELRQIYRANAAYSDIVMLSPGCVGVLYENGEAGNTYKCISFAAVDIDDKSVR